MRAWLLLGLIGCAHADQREVVRVFAASSLTDAWADLEAHHEAAHPDHDVQLVFAGSQVLQMQLSHGAPADLLAVADAGPIQALGARLGPSEVFAAGELVVAVAADSPMRTALDLPLAQRLVMGLPDAPIGRYTLAALDAAAREEGQPWRQAVEARVVSRESNVRLVRTKIELGAADAAIVYASDLVDSPLRVVPLPASWQPEVRYHLATVGAPTPASEAVLATLRSPEGQAILRTHGLRPLP